jgi:pyridoxamine 5'-phosphate oxidase
VDATESFDAPARLLTEADAGGDPLALFARWYAEARAARLQEPDAAALATVGASGRPAVRMVLMRGFDARGFVFFTNYTSRKTRELDTNPFAAMTMWWDVLERQVRIEGAAERVSDAESDAYFASRPPGSQLGAWASPQSALIPDRATLERSVAEAAERFRDAPVPRPPFWGGIRIIPSFIEFWQGRSDRLHDRFAFTRLPDGGWSRSRLGP